jgi:hypothetical protein
LRGILSIGIALACVLPTLSALPAAADTPEAINVQGALCGAVAGSPLAGAVATFTDTDVTVPASRFRATIFWEMEPSRTARSAARPVRSPSPAATRTQARHRLSPFPSSCRTTCGRLGAVQFRFDVAPAPDR